MEREKTKRLLSVDLIRIVAFFLVITVHSFLHLEYYNTPFEGMSMAGLTFIRTLAMSCVPLFIVLTGYLMSEKRLCKEYYKGIVRTLIVFAIAEICCIIYDSIVFEKPILEQIKVIGAAHYSWYIDMYIGLFLIIPFLNLSYNGIKNIKQKQIFVLTLFAICCAVPTFFSFFWLSQGWWKAAYPLAYYFAGCYIKENKPKLSSWKYLAVAFLSAATLTFLLYLRNPQRVIKIACHTDYGSAFMFVISIALFCAIIRQNDKLDKSKLCWKILPRLSRLTLGAYLISYITDDIIYDTLTAYVHSYSTQFYFLPLTVTVSIIASLCLSYFINLICDGIFQIIKHIKA